MQAGRIAESVLDALRTENENASATDGLISTSIGIALFPADAADRTSLMSHADTALYRAKADGRGIYRFFESAMGEQVRERRRIDFTLGLTYGTTAAQIEEFIFKLKNYLEDLTLIDENDVRVHFLTYNSSSLDIRVVCYAKTGKHLEYLNIMQEINLHTLELLEEVGVSCAFPSTSLYFETPLQENVTEQPAKVHAEANKPKDNNTSANC